MPDMGKRFSHHTNRENPLTHNNDVLAVVAAERRELPRSREAGGARRRQVVEDHAGNVGSVRSERK